MSTIEELQQENNDLRETVNLLRARLMALSQPKMRFEEDCGPNGEDGMAMTADDPAGLMGLLFEACAKMLDRGGAVNYLAWRGYSAGSGGVEIIAQRVGKLSPHEARAQAEQHLKRAVEMLAEHGIAWDGPTTFLPDKPIDDGIHVTQHDWLRLDYRRQPNVLVCQRCRGEQEMPARGAPAVFSAVIEAFTALHEGCVEAEPAPEVKP